MAYIYGSPSAEKNLLKLCPQRIESINDIKPTLQQHEKTIDEKQTEFHTNLPQRIDEEKQHLTHLEEQYNELGTHWNVQIQQIIDENNEKC